MNLELYKGGACLLTFAANMVWPSNYASEFELPVRELEFLRDKTCVVQRVDDQIQNTCRQQVELWCAGTDEVLGTTTSTVLVDPWIWKVAELRCLFGPNQIPPPAVPHLQAIHEIINPPDADGGAEDPP